MSDIGVPADIPLPVDISITADNQGLWVDTFLDGKTRYFDISDPHAPKQVYEEVIGSQINMVSQSWDGKRVYFSSSLLGNWDKTGDADEQYVKLYHWNGESLEHQWTVDFYEQGLGRAHQMRFDSYAMYGMQPRSKESPIPYYLMPFRVLFGSDSVFDTQHPSDANLLASASHTVN